MRRPAKPYRLRPSWRCRGTGAIRKSPRCWLAHSVVAVQFTPRGASSAGRRHSAVVCCLTFEVRRDRQQDAWPGRKDDMPHLQAGPSGLLLGLASTEGLGRTARHATARVTANLWRCQPQPRKRSKNRPHAAPGRRCFPFRARSAGLAVSQTRSSWRSASSGLRAAATLGSRSAFPQFMGTSANSTESRSSAQRRSLWITQVPASFSGTWAKDRQPVRRPRKPSRYGVDLVIYLGKTRVLADIDLLVDPVLLPLVSAEPHFRVREQLVGVDVVLVDRLASLQRTREGRCSTALLPQCLSGSPGPRRWYRAGCVVRPNAIVQAQPR